MRGRLNDIKDWTELAQKANWAVANLADLCNVSKRTLEMYFLQVLGKTPKSWLLEHRQKLAISFLREGHLIKRVATEMGYKHPTHFSREFKKYWGFSPGQFCPERKMTHKMRVLVLD